MEYENQDMLGSVTSVSFTMTPVSIKGRKNGLTLIQWEEDETYKRAWIRDESVIQTDKDSYVVDPHVGIPYGFDFTLLVELATTAKVIDRELKRRGIWTLEDLRRDTAASLGAIQSAYGETLATILRKVDKYEKESNEPLEEDVDF